MRSRREGRADSRACPAPGSAPALGPGSYFSSKDTEAPKGETACPKVWLLGGVAGTWTLHRTLRGPGHFEPKTMGVRGHWGWTELSWKLLAFPHRLSEPALPMDPARKALPRRACADRSLSSFRTVKSGPCSTQGPCHPPRLRGFGTLRASPVRLESVRRPLRKHAATPLRGFQPSGSSSLRGACTCFAVAGAFGSSRA